MMLWTFTHNHHHLALLYDFQHSNTQLQLNLFVSFSLLLLCLWWNEQQKWFKEISLPFVVAVRIFFSIFLANLLIHCHTIFHFTFLLTWKFQMKNINRSEVDSQDEIESWTFSWYWTWRKLHEQLKINARISLHPPQNQQTHHHKESWVSHFWTSPAIVDVPKCSINKKRNLTLKIVNFFVSRVVSTQFQTQLNFNCRKFCIFFGNEDRFWHWEYGKSERHLTNDTREVRPLDGRFAMIALKKHRRFGILQCKHCTSHRKK